jgi:mannose-binding lectin 2
MISNGSLHYDHDRDGIKTNIAGCESPFRGREVDTLVAIRYQNNRLTVSTDIEGNNIWKECFSIDDVQLPTHYYFGFTAATGELSDNHDIISVHTYQLDTSEQRRTEDRKNIIPNAPSSAVENASGTNSNTSTWSALKVFFFVLFLVIVCLGGAIGVYYYSKSRRYHSSRLY